MFEDHYQEEIPKEISGVLGSVDFNERRERLLREQKRARFSMDDKRVLPISLFPRVLPKNYHHTLEETCRRFTEDFIARLYDPNKNQTSNDLTMFRMLIRDGVTEALPQVLIGGMRYDMALVDLPTQDNTPHILEVNALNYHGIGWVPLVEKLYLATFPELSDLLEHHDMDFALAENLSRLGKSFVMVVEEDPNYEDSAIFRSKMNKYGIKIRIIADSDFIRKLSDGTLGLSAEGIKLDGKHYDALYLRAFCDTRQIMDYRKAVREIIRSNVPTYDNLGVLLLEDKLLVSNALDEAMREELRRNPSGRVLKKRVGSGGKSVYVGEEMNQLINDGISLRNWCVQDMLKLNTMITYPSDGVCKLGIVDVACYVTYRFVKDKGLTDFKLAGVMVRSSQNSYKVNISNGGCFVPVFYSKN